jgi:hypothetical protein
MNHYNTPPKKRVRINEEKNIERLDSGNFPKEKRKLFTITPYDVKKAHYDIENENRYGVGPGGLMTGPELSDMYENYKYPESEKFQNLWGTVDFNPDDDFSNELLERSNKKQRYSGGKKSRKSGKSRKTRKSKKH